MSQEFHVSDYAQIDEAINFIPRDVDVNQDSIDAGLIPENVALKAIFETLE